MISLREIGALTKNRRQDVGLSRARLAKLSGISRATLCTLEAGSLSDLGFNQLNTLLNILGMSFDMPTPAARARKNGLWMVARSCSVSYQKELSRDELSTALSTGMIPIGLEANLTHFFAETPAQLMVMAVEETASCANIHPVKVWKNIDKLANSLNKR